MVTLSSCLNWQIISFILPPNEYGCVYTRTMLRSGPAIDLQKMPILAKKIIFSDEAHFDLAGYVNKQNYRISMAILVNFCSQELKRRILATFVFNRTALRATQPKLHSMLCALFLKIALSAAGLMSFGPPQSCDFTPLGYFTCGVPSKTSVTPTSKRQLTIKDNWQ